MTKEQIADKRVYEDHVCTLMIQMYCKGAHKNKGAMKAESNLCPECGELADYVHQRVLRCPHMETKSFCSMCKTHCYKPEMRQKIKTVMRYAGPRMLKYHPVLALKHVYLTIKEIKKMKKTENEKTRG